MRAEEILETLTDDELREKADACFIQAENTPSYQHVGESQVYLPINAAERQRLLAEADFYLKALAWRSDARTGRRDFWMEVAVIVLIGIEIILSLVFGFGAIRDSRDQARILAHMDRSAAATADAMKAASTSLQSLADAQDKSLERLNQMSGTLRDSLKTSSTMAGATRQQLDILQQEQAARAAQLTRKPSLRLYIGHTPLIGSPNDPPAREQTDTSTTFDCVLVNEGTASATKPLLRVIVGTYDVSLQSPANFTMVPMMPGLRGPNLYLLDIDTIRAGVHMLIPLTFSFPKGHAAFSVFFNVDADEIAVGTWLGVLGVTPRKPTDASLQPH